jgi:hypothetical protein
VIHSARLQAIAARVIHASRPGVTCDELVSDLKRALRAAALHHDSTLTTTIAAVMARRLRRRGTGQNLPTPSTRTGMVLRSSEDGSKDFPQFETATGTRQNSVTTPAPNRMERNHRRG